MALTPQEKDLVSEVRDAEIQWRVRRWFELLVYVMLAAAGFLLPYEDARIFGIIGIVFLVNLLRGWKGDPTRRLLLSLAKRLDEHKDDD
jgi:hypothetical protein